MRRFIRDLLGQDHPRLDDALLVAADSSRIPSHSRSGQGGFVTVALPGSPVHSIQIRVIDDGSERRSRTSATIYTPRTAGLLIVENLADEWGMEAGNDGTTIWARLDFPDSCV
jgi:hypothetical protein